MCENSKSASILLPEIFFLVDNPLEICHILEVIFLAFAFRKNINYLFKSLCLNLELPKTKFGINTLKFFMSSQYNAVIRNRYMDNVCSVSQPYIHEKMVTNLLKQGLCLQLPLTADILGFRNKILVEYLRCSLCCFSQSRDYDIVIWWIWNRFIKKKTNFAKLRKHHQIWLIFEVLQVRCTGRSDCRKRKLELFCMIGKQFRFFDWLVLTVCFYFKNPLFSIHVSMFISNNRKIFFSSGKTFERCFCLFEKLKTTEDYCFLQHIDSFAF